MDREAAANAHAVKPEVALSYVPVLIGQLDGDGREMLGAVMQAMYDHGIECGRRDAEFQSKKDRP
jgi:hypothetical protein